MYVHMYIFVDALFIINFVEINKSSRTIISDSNSMGALKLGLIL